MTLDNEGIVKYIESFDKETKAIKEDLLQLCWFMRGSITYDDAIMLSHEDRQLINKLIKDNLETTEKTGLPFF